MPEPVGPVTRIIPKGLDPSSRTRARASGSSISLSSPQLGRSTVQQAQTDLLPDATGQGVDAEIDSPVAVLAANAAVLGLAPFGDVEIRQDFESGRHRRDQATGERLHVLLEHTVLAETQTQSLLLWLHVNVTGPY